MLHSTVFCLSLCCQCSERQKKRPGTVTTTNNFNHKNFSHEHAIIKHQPFLTGSKRDPVNSIYPGPQQSHQCCRRLEYPAPEKKQGTEKVRFIIEKNNYKNI